MFSEVADMWFLLLHGGVGLYAFPAVTCAALPGPARQDGRRKKAGAGMEEDSNMALPAHLDAGSDRGNATVACCCKSNKRSGID